MHHLLFLKLWVYCTAVFNFDFSKAVRTFYSWFGFLAVIIKPKSSLIIFKNQSEAFKKITNADLFYLVLFLYHMKSRLFFKNSPKKGTVFLQPLENLRNFISILLKAHFLYAFCYHVLLIFDSHISIKEDNSAIFLCVLGKNAEIVFNANLAYFRASMKESLL